jgi:hypothetical protein
MNSSIPDGWVENKVNLLRTPKAIANCASFLIMAALAISDWRLFPDTEFFFNLVAIGVLICSYPYYFYLDLVAASTWNDGDKIGLNYYIRLTQAVSFALLWIVARKGFFWFALLMTIIYGTYVLWLVKNKGKIQNEKHARMMIGCDAVGFAGSLALLIMSIFNAIPTIAKMFYFYDKIDKGTINLRDVMDFVSKEVWVCMICVAIGFACIYGLFQSMTVYGVPRKRVLEPEQGGSNEENK